MNIFYLGNLFSLTRMNSWVNHVNVVGPFVPVFHWSGRPCGHCQRLLGTAWCRVGGPTFTLPGHVGGCGTESRRRRTSRRRSGVFQVFFSDLLGRMNYVMCWFLLGCFFLWFDLYTQCCVWSWIAQINIIRISIRFLQDFPLRNGMPPDQKKKAYRCDVTYVTNSHSVFGWFSAADFFQFGTWWKWFSIEDTGVKRTLLIGVMALVGAHLAIFCWQFFWGYSCGLVWEVVRPTLFEMAIHWSNTRVFFPSFFVEETYFC